MIVKDKYKSKEVKAGSVWRYGYYYVIGIHNNNGTIYCKDFRGRRVVRHLLGVDVVKM